MVGDKGAGGVGKRNARPGEPEGCSAGGESYINRALRRGTELNTDNSYVSTHTSLISGTKLSDTSISRCLYSKFLNVQNFWQLSTCAVQLPCNSQEGNEEEMKSLT